ELVGHTVHLARRHDPNDGIGLAVHANGLAHDLRPPPKPAPPETVRKNDHVVPARLVLVRPEVTADNRRHSQARELARRYLRARHLLRPFAASEVGVESAPRPQ